MSRHARRLNLTANALFLVGGCTYALMDVMNTAIYRLALIVIFLAFRILWSKAMLKRAQNEMLNEVDRRRHGRANLRARHEEMSVDQDYADIRPAILR